MVEVMPDPHELPNRISETRITAISSHCHGGGGFSWLTASEGSDDNSGGISTKVDVVSVVFFGGCCSSMTDACCGRCYSTESKGKAFLGV